MSSWIRTGRLREKLSAMGKIFPTMSFAPTKAIMTFALERKARTRKRLLFGGLNDRPRDLLLRRLRPACRKRITMKNYILGIDPGWAGGAALNLGRNISWHFHRIECSRAQEVFSRIYSNFRVLKNVPCYYRILRDWTRRYFLGQGRCGGQVHWREDSGQSFLPSRADVLDKNSFLRLDVVAHKLERDRLYSRAYISFRRPSYNYFGQTVPLNYISRHRPLFARLRYGLTFDNYFFPEKQNDRNNGILVSDNRTFSAFPERLSCGNTHFRENENRHFHSILLRGESCQ